MTDTENNITFIGRVGDDPVFIVEYPDDSDPMDAVQLMAELIPCSEFQFRVRESDVPGCRDVCLLSTKMVSEVAGCGLSDWQSLVEENVTLPEPAVADWATFIQRINPVVRCVIAFGRATVEFRVNARTHAVVGSPSVGMGIPLDIAAAFIHICAEKN